MNISSMGVTDASVLKLFSEHDDFMIDFLGEDKVYYTRYNESENIEKVWVVFSDNLPVGCIAYRKKEEGTGEVKRLYIKKEYRGKGISKELLKTLEAEERLIVTLMVFEGYKSLEIAQMLHRNHSTIRSKYRRALQKLKKELLKEPSSIKPRERKDPHERI